MTAVYSETLTVLTRDLAKESFEEGTVSIIPLHSNDNEKEESSASASSVVTPTSLHSQIALLTSASSPSPSSLESSTTSSFSSLSFELTSLLSQREFEGPSEALNTLLNPPGQEPLSVCQYAFQKNDIVWVCRTCQTDETCVLCHNCFTQSNHEGHDVAFYHAQAGGCCDCGDSQAWDPQGFCPNHGVRHYAPTVTTESQRLPFMVAACADWLTQTESHTDRDEDLKHNTNNCTHYVALLYSDMVSHSTWLSSLRRYWGTEQYFTDSLLEQFVRLLQTKGQIIVGKINPTSNNDNDILTDLPTLLYTKRQLQKHHRAVTVLQWLSQVAHGCHAYCEIVANNLKHEHLTPLLTDLQAPAQVTQHWYALLLTLLSVPAFKGLLAQAYGKSYVQVAHEFAVKGRGVLERSGYQLSVQFLNRVQYVMELVQEGDLLGQIGKALAQSFAAALLENTNDTLNVTHHVVVDRRYAPCISDLKCVLNVPEMGLALIRHDGFWKNWCQVLRYAQGMNAQTWLPFTRDHVSEESRAWVGAFNVSISLSSLFDRLWHEAALPERLQELHALISSWQEDHIPQANMTATSVHDRSSRSCPFSTISHRHGVTDLSFEHVPWAQTTPTSFHWPLLRFLAAGLRELADITTVHLPNVTAWPTLTLTRAAQVRAGLWRRNGSTLTDQVLNYAEPPFCRTLRDADLLLVQFGLAQQGKVVNWIHECLGRLGIFEFCGLQPCPQWNVALYMEQVQQGRYPGQVAPEVVLPHVYSISNDAVVNLALLEELLHLLLLVITELPSPRPASKEEATALAEARLYDQVVHRLASGPKTHSELQDGHHVLSHHDNVLLQEQGKRLQLHDATGACLAGILEKVATASPRTHGQPTTWELKDWSAYNPTFPHVTPASHEMAAERRPKTEGPYAPPPREAHPFYARLRRDFVADAAVLAILYRSLHIHAAPPVPLQKRQDVPGNYVSAKNEAVLARAIHMLTLGFYAWTSPTTTGGDLPGSIFYRRQASPTVADWIEQVLLKSPAEIMACDWYQDQPSILLLLHRIATNDTKDRVKAGAVWLCQQAAHHSSAGAKVLEAQRQQQEQKDASEEMLKRKKRAKEAAMAQMKAQAAKFLMDMDIDDDDTEMSNEGSPQRRSTASSLGSETICGLANNNAPRRLLKTRPVCIICNDSDHDMDKRDGEERKKSRRKTENALCWVGYTQPSTVLKHSPHDTVSEFVGVHVALCGHAVHSECCESYLVTVSHREDRAIGKRDEFKCPLCQRLSNCLVPFIDVAADWIESTRGTQNMRLHDFLSSTPWWTRHELCYWDGQSAFVETPSRPQRSNVRSLRKKDLYTAWSAMMKTPRFLVDCDGETLAWRRFMDQISDLSYRADSKRLGDSQLHDLFGDFRHYIVEKYSYNTWNRYAGSEQVDWPLCLATDTMPDDLKQVMSREKLLSKLLLSIQAFTYSCCSEAYEAKRKSEFVKFGIVGVILGRLVVLPQPSPQIEDGAQPFSGRLGKLRYLVLPIIAAAGAVAADLIQIALGWPVSTTTATSSIEDRAPVAYPILHGHVLTRVVTAMCAVSGRARARRDELPVQWSASFDDRGNFIDPDYQETTLDDDCEGFLKLGLLARILQVLLGGMKLPLTGLVEETSYVADLNAFLETQTDGTWTKICAIVLLSALVNSGQAPEKKQEDPAFDAELFESCASLALDAACNYLIDAGTVFQIILPGTVVSYEGFAEMTTESLPNPALFEKLSVLFRLESLEEMLASPWTRQILSGWYTTAIKHARSPVEPRLTLKMRLYRTQGWHVYDWPLVVNNTCAAPIPSSMGPNTVAFSSTNTVPLLASNDRDVKSAGQPRILAIPTSYTDLYAELAAIMPNCEQIAVCLVCGQVLNASGKGECTKHTLKCGAGAGIFFLLQECSGLVMHKNKAAYMHSLYVDAHGETPQYRGRPLNLDPLRYEQLQELWFGHQTRQQVVSERAVSRQVILPEFY